VGGLFCILLQPYNSKEGGRTSRVIEKGREKISQVGLIEEIAVFSMKERRVYMRHFRNLFVAIMVLCLLTSSAWALP